MNEIKAGDRSIASWKEPDNKGRNVRIDFGFEIEISTNQKKELACLIGRFFRIKNEYITTNEATHCENIAKSRNLNAFLRGME